MSSYITRHVDAELDHLCEDVPAIVLRGARGVGKSTTARLRAATVYNLEDPAELALLVAQPLRLASRDIPILVDEWQRWPECWDHIRRQVDASFSPGRFLIAGSASPSDETLHPGAGRFVFLRMRPMTLAERGVESPTVSLADLLADGRGEVAGDTDVTLDRYAEEIMASGFPAARSVPARSRDRYFDGYLAAIYSYAIAGDAEVPLPTRDVALMRCWAEVYAAASATTASAATLREAAATRRDITISDKRSVSLQTAFETAFIFDPLEAWLPTFNPLRRLGQGPKHHLVDPALAAALLGLDVGQLLGPGAAKQFIAKQRPMLGALFESLVVQSVRVYAEASNATPYHLRTHRGEHEIDLIVQRKNGGVVALEVKLRGTPKSKDFEHLAWLKARIGDRLIDGAIITSGAHAYRDPETGFAVIPAALLGP